MDRTRSIKIELPDFRTMSDEAVQTHILSRHRDGRWSALTKMLLDAFGTEKLELNEAWADHWTDWACPACHRPKIELARLTDHNVLLCQLDRHHDHLRDHAVRLMRNLLLREMEGEARKTAERAISAALPLIERFAETLLCNDCNAADGAMKAQLGSAIPNFFSFSPSEIARFVIVAPNRSHELNVGVGQAIWTAVKDDVVQRIDFAKMLGARIGAGQHDREQPSFDPHRDADDRKLLFTLAYEASNARSRIDGIARSLIARSRSTAGRWSAAKAKPVRKVEVPDQAVFEQFDATRTAASRWWRDSSGTWRCPCCDRSKFEIVRRSNNGKWTGNIMVVQGFEIETNPASLARRAVYHPGPVFLASHHQVGLCQDCRQILTDAQSIRPGHVEACFSLGQLRSLVETPRPHTGHDIDPHAIGDSIDANIDWLEGVADYWAHHRQADDISLEHYRAMKSGMTALEAREVVIPKLVTADKLPGDGAAGWFDWWLNELERMRKAAMQPLS